MENQNERGQWTSASNAEADSLCPGRHLAQRGLPEKESKDANYGALIHRALDGDAVALKELTSQQLDILESCIEIEQKLLAQFFGSETSEKIIREQRFWVHAPNREWSHSGQPDIVFRHGNRALILDRKTLAGDVSKSESNMQLRDYAVLVALNLLVEEIGVAIVQPLVTHSPRICVYGKGELTLARVEMRDRITKSNDPNSKRIAGEKQCKFCRAKNNCLEYQRFAGSELPVAKSLLDAPLSAWTGEHFAAFQAKKSVAQKWLDDADDATKAFMQSGGEVPGYLLKEGIFRETVTDPQTLFNRFSELGGTNESFLGCVSVAKTKLKDAVASVTKAKGKTLDFAVQKLIEGCVEKKQTAPSIVKSEKQLNETTI